MLHPALIACAVCLQLLLASAAARADATSELAPTGRLRAAINFGNIVLAQKDAAGQPRGVSVDLARELGKRLGKPVDLVTFDAAGKVTDAMKTGTLDICFLAIDPVRAAGIDFTAPYVIIEGTYLVPDASPLKAIADVDREGIRIAVGQGSAYDLHLARTIKQAKLVRAASSPEAISLFQRDKLEVVAGVKQALVAFAKATPGMRVMDGRIMVIEQAIGTPAGRAAGLAYLKSFVEEMKASGFVARGLEATGQHEAAVAPPAK